MRQGGLTAVNCTCCVWEGFVETMEAVAQWKQWFREYQDILTQVLSTSDIRRARVDGRVGVLLDWQNTTGFGAASPVVAPSPSPRPRRPNSDRAPTVVASRRRDSTSVARGR
jgi:hypothetical protein